MTDSPEGQTQSCSQDEEMRRNFYRSMVDRFLSWKLPEAFHPDAGISFKAEYNEGTPWPMRHEPIGTNLLSADQVMEMFKHCVDMTGIENRFTELFAENIKLKEQLTQANETIAALQARIEAADNPLIYADVGHLREVSNGNDMNIYASSEQDEQRRLEPLFTRPPITSERELELLAVIEQMRDKVKSLIRFQRSVACGTSRICAVSSETSACLMDFCANLETSIALTPESALKEHDNEYQSDVQAAAGGSSQTAIE